MNQKRWICLLLCLLLAALSLTACQRKQPSEGTPTADSTSPSESGQDGGAEFPTDVSLTLCANRKTDYVIVYPDDASDDLMAAIIKLRNDFKAVTGVSILIRPDYYLSAEDSIGASEIVVGRVDRREGDVILGSVRGIYDYAVAACGNKLILAAHDDAAAVKAVNWLSEEFLGKANADAVQASGLIFSSEQNYFYHYSYPMQSQTVFGNAYDSYRIVVPKNATQAETRFALRLQQLIQRMNGALPKIVDDTAEATAYEIRVGKTSRTAATVSGYDYVVAANGQSVEMLCGFVSGYDYFYKDISNRMFPSLHDAAANSGEIMKTDLSSKVEAELNPTILKKTGDLRIVYHNIWGVYASNERNQIASEVYLQMDADVICLQEYTDLMYQSGSVMDHLKAYGYAEVQVPAVAGIRTCTPIVYRTDRLTLVEQGVHRYEPSTVGNSYDKFLTWAVFRTKDTGETFGVLSVHFAYQSPPEGDAYRLAQIPKVMEVTRYIQSTYNAPVLAGGDLNCTAVQVAYQALLDEGMKDIQKLATVTDEGGSHFGGPTVNDLGFYVSQPLSDKKSYSTDAYDHVFYMGTNELTFHTYDNLADPYTMAVSDHTPVVVDFSFFSKG